MREPIQVKRAASCRHFGRAPLLALAASVPAARAQQGPAPSAPAIRFEEVAEKAGVDRKYIWHPFTQMREWEMQEPIIISEGRDCYLRDISGRWYLDGVSSLWVNIFGHRKKELDEAIKTQLDRISHSTLLGLSNPPAIRLAERLVKTVNASLLARPVSGGSSKEDLLSLSKVFYSDNGSTAVEVALKMALQYWQHLGEQTRTAFLSLNNAYHGDTLGAVSVGGGEIFHRAFGPLLI